MKLQDPKPCCVEGQAPPNDHCAFNSGCPQHKMNSHLSTTDGCTTPSTANVTKARKADAVDQTNTKGKHQRYDDAVRPPEQDLAEQRVLDTIVGSTYNE